MGLVIMSERELNRIEVLAQVDDGRLSVQNGANMLDIIKRQMFRLLKTYRTDGARETCWDIVPSDTTGPLLPLNRQPFATVQHRKSGRLKFPAKDAIQTKNQKEIDLWAS